MDERFVWVKEFIDNVRPYIAVRTTDHVLIKRPNVVQKLNPSGAIILKNLLDGKPIEGLLQQIGPDEARLGELLQFFHAIRQSLEGSLDVWTTNQAVSKKAFSAPFTSLPVLSEVAITGRCNFKCSFCYAGINHGCTVSTPDLSQQAWQSIIEKIATEAQVPSISFTGGEPTLRSDLPALIAFAKRLGMRVNLISNGFLIDEKMIEKFVAAGLDSAQISIEGCTEQTHEHITGVKGSFDRVLHAVKKLNAAGIRTHTNTTLSRQNMHEAALLPAFLKETLDAERFSMNLIIPSGTALSIHDHLLPYHASGEIIQNIRDAALLAGIEFLWYSPVPLCLFNTITEGLGNKGCAACDGLLSVDPTGNILPCSSWNEPLGSLLDVSFHEIWNAPRATHIRHKKEAPSVCFTCDSLDLCQGACPLFYRQGCGNQVAELKARQSNITQKLRS